jgi:hypothetical protein
VKEVLLVQLMRAMVPLVPLPRDLLQSPLVVQSSLFPTV